MWYATQPLFSPLCEILCTDWADEFTRYNVSTDEIDWCSHAGRRNRRPGDPLSSLAVGTLTWLEFSWVDNLFITHPTFPVVGRMILEETGRRLWRMRCWTVQHINEKPGKTLCWFHRSQPDWWHSSFDGSQPTTYHRLVISPPFFAFHLSSSSWLPLATNVYRCSLCAHINLIWTQVLGITISLKKKIKPLIQQDTPRC